MADVEDLAKKQTRDAPDRVPRNFLQRQDTRRKVLPIWRKLNFCGCAIPAGLTMLQVLDPDEVSEIFLQVGQNMVTFGAQLASFHPSRKYPYHRHFLCHIQRQSPADMMKLMDEDEMVFANDAFLPKQTHNEVLTDFKNVKVDGETRFCLITRRSSDELDERGKKKKVWIETSCEFVPEHRDPDRASEAVLVRHERVSRSADKDFYKTSEHKLQVQGISAYLAIQPYGQVLATVNTPNDDATKITKCDRIWFAGKRYHVTSSLYREIDGRKWYVNIEENSVTAKTAYQGLNCISDGIRMTISNKEKFVACNKSTGMFVAAAKKLLDRQPSKYSYYFEDYSIISGLYNQTHSQNGTHTADNTNIHAVVSRASSTSSLASSVSSARSRSSSTSSDSDRQD